MQSQYSESENECLQRGTQHWFNDMANVSTTVYFYQNINQLKITITTIQIAGIRQEQDIFVRLIDSATKTVSPFKMKMIHKCCWFWKKLPFEDLSCWWQWDQSQRDERRPGVSIFRALPSARTLPHNRAHIAAHHNSRHNAAHHDSLSPQPQPCHLWTTKYQSRHPHNSPSPSPVLQTAK